MAQLDFKNLAPGTIVVCSRSQTLHKLSGAAATAQSLRQLWGNDPGQVWRGATWVSCDNDALAVFIEYYEQHNIGWIKLLHPDHGVLLGQVGEKSFKLSVFKTT